GRWRLVPLVLLIPVAVGSWEVAANGASPVGTWISGGGAFRLTVGQETHCLAPDILFLQTSGAGVGGGLQVSKTYVWETSGSYPLGDLAFAPVTLPAMPAEAGDTGIHRGGWQIWVAPRVGDDAVYLMNRGV